MVEQPTTYRITTEVSQRVLDILVNVANCQPKGSNEHDKTLVVSAGAEKAVACATNLIKPAKENIGAYKTLFSAVNRINHNRGNHGVLTASFSTNDFLEKHQGHLVLYAPDTASERMRQSLENARPGSSNVLDQPANLLVSNETNKTLESKVNTATSINFLQSPGGLKFIEGYLEKLGYDTKESSKKAKSVQSALKEHSPKTGTLKTGGLLQAFNQAATRGEGVVIQEDFSGGGTGTAIFSLEKIKMLLQQCRSLKTPEEKESVFIEALAEKLDRDHETLRTLLDQGKLAWQQKILASGHELKEMSAQLAFLGEAGKGKPLFEIFAATDQFCDPDGTHRGNVIYGGNVHLNDRLEKYNSGIEDFHLAMEALLHHQLTSHGFPGGLLDENYNADLISVDLILEQDKKPIISEVNCRTNFSSRGMQNALAHEQDLPIIAVHCGGFPEIEKDVFMYIRDSIKTDRQQAAFAAYLDQDLFDPVYQVGERFGLDVKLASVQISENNELSKTGEKRIEGFGPIFTVSVAGKKQSELLTVQDELKKACDQIKRNINALTAEKLDKNIQHYSGYTAGINYSEPAQLVSKSLSDA